MPKLPSVTAWLRRLATYTQPILVESPRPALPHEKAMKLFGKDTYRSALELNHRPGPSQLERLAGWSQLILERHQSTQDLEYVSRTVSLIPADDRVMICRYLIDPEFRRPSNSSQNPSFSN